ncbi:hypothetical protein ACQPUY_04275 [Clostridium nigeriense]|uniref:hypothetical protein n=1 Tax=Clostridium nigeriense TaxID=1805470 RepID=UPI003D353BE0
MNNYNLIMRLQAKMQDPRFSERFNRIVSEFNSIPGVQQEVMRIVQIEDERKREKAISRLPDRVKKLVREVNSLLNE